MLKGWETKISSFSEKQSFFFPPLIYTRSCMAQSNMKKLKIVTCVARSFFFLWTWHQLLLYLSLWSQLREQRNRQEPAQQAGGEPGPSWGCRGRLRRAGALPQEPLPLSSFFTKSCPSASAALPLLRHTHRDTHRHLWIDFSKKTPKCTLVAATNIRGEGLC